jgi:hypothetical protein
MNMVRVSEETNFENFKQIGAKVLLTQKSGF